MRTRTIVILWIAPIFVIIFTFIGLQFYDFGLFEPWQLIGKPSENLTKIIGVKFAERKLYVLTSTGNTYSIVFICNPNFICNMHPPAISQWIKEINDNVSTELVEYYGGYQLFTPPPPLFKPIQTFGFGIPATEVTFESRFALSDDGNLWYWSHALGAYQGLLNALILAVEILAYFLALFIYLVTSITRKLRRKIS